MSLYTLLVLPQYLFPQTYEAGCVSTISLWLLRSSGNSHYFPMSSKELNLSFFIKSSLIIFVLLRWHWSLASRWSCAGWTWSCGPGAWTEDRPASEWRSAPALIDYPRKTRVFSKRNNCRWKEGIAMNRAEKTISRPDSGEHRLYMIQTLSPLVPNQNLNWWVAVNLLKGLECVSRVLNFIPAPRSPRRLLHEPQTVERRSFGAEVCSR